MKKTRLDADLIEKICDLVKLRLTWVKIAHAIGVTDTTLRNWRSKGEAAKSGIYRTLVDAIRTAKADLYEEYSSVVRDAALYGSKTVTKKIIIAADGTRRTEIVERTTGADAELALKLLALMDPGHWSSVKQIKIDWQKPVEASGLDPQTVEQAFFQYLEKNQDKIGDVVIPEIPDRTV